MNKSIRLFQLPAIAMVIILLFASLSAVSAQEEASCGDVFEGELDGDTASYEISVEEGELLYIDLTSDDFDTLLEVYEDGDLVFNDDDGGEALNSRLVISEEGDYEIVVTSYAGDAEGDYELSINCAGSCEIVEDELDGDTAQYEFEAGEGDTILALLTSDYFDTLVNLLDEDEDEIASDDDSAGNLNSLLIYEIEDDGDYILEVTSFSGDAEGEFTMIFCADAEGVDIDSEEAPEILECGDTVEGTVDNGFPVVFFLFEGEEGDEVTINLNAADGSELDPYLGLYSPSSAEDEETVAENDDTNGFDSEIVYELEEDGIYIIVATRYNFEDGDSEGDFELEISCD